MLLKLLAQTEMNVWLNTLKCTSKPLKSNYMCTYTRMYMQTCLLARRSCTRWSWSLSIGYRQSWLERTKLHLLWTNDPSKREDLLVPSKFLLFRAWEDSAYSCSKGPHQKTPIHPLHSFHRSHLAISFSSWAPKGLKMIFSSTRFRSSGRKLCIMAAWESGQALIKEMNQKKPLSERRTTLIHHLAYYFWWQLDSYPLLDCKMA